jgi:hypothetical protein
MSLVMTLDVVLAVFCFDAAVGQEGYLGHDHDKWHRGFYQMLERVCAPFKFNGQPDHLYCVVVPPEI